MLPINKLNICSPIDAFEQSRDKLKILIVASSPIDESAHTSYQKEISEIFAALTFHSVSAALIQLNPPTREKLFSVLSSCSFDVIHFIGHSNEHGIQLEDSIGRASWLSIEELRDFMRDANVKTRLIIMNTCESFNIGYLLESGNIPNIIVTTSVLSNDLAIKVSTEIYSYLASNRPIEDIVNIANRIVKDERLNGDANAVIALGTGKSQNIFSTRPQSGSATYFNCKPQNNLPIPRHILYDMVNEIIDVYNAIQNEANPFIGILALPGKGKTVLSLLSAIKYSWKFQKGIAYTSFKEKDSFDVVEFFSHFNWKLGEYAVNERTEIALYELSRGAYLLIFDEIDNLPECEQIKIAEFLRRWDVSLGGRAIFTVNTQNVIIENLICGNRIKIHRFPFDASIDLFIDSLGGKDKADLLGLSPQVIVNKCLDNPKLITLTASALKAGISWNQIEEQLDQFSGVYECIVSVLDSIIAHIEISEPTTKFFLDSCSCFNSIISEDCWRYIACDVLDEKSQPDVRRLNDRAINMLINADIVHIVDKGGISYLQVDPTASKYIRGKKWDNLPKQQIAKCIKRHITYSTLKIKSLGFDYVNNEWDNIIFSIKNAESEGLFDEVLAITKSLVGEISSILLVNNMWHYSNNVLPFAIKSARELHDDIQLTKFLYIFGLINYRLAEYNDAYDCFCESKEICESGNMGFLLYENEIEIGRIYYRLEKYEDSKKIFNTLLSLDINCSISSKACHELGRLAFREGDSIVALDFLEQALGYRRELKDCRAEAQTLHEIARVYHQLKNYTNAKANYEESYNIKMKEKDWLGLEATLHQMGLLHYENGEFLEAKDKYEECIDISNELKDRFWIIHNNFRYGCLLWKLNQKKKEAKTMIMEALELSELLGIRIKREITVWINENETELDLF